MFRITFLRHGESLGNQGGIVQGQSDMPLTERGMKQAQALAAYWQAHPPGFETLVSSPQQRARQTAEVVGHALRLAVETDALWMERGFGSLEGKTVEAAQEQDPPVDFYHPYTRIGETGESVFDLFIRAGTALQNLLLRPPGNYLVVSHGALLNMIYFNIIGITPQGHYHSPRIMFENTAFSQLTYDEQIRQWRIWSVNHRPHWLDED